MRIRSTMLTIIFSTHNSKREYVDEAINSILNQTNQDFEVLIVDDASDDKCVQMLEEIKKNSSYNNICNLCKEYEEGLISYIDFYKYFKMINLSEKIQIIIPGSNYKLTYKDCTLDKFLKYGMSDANFDEIYINGKKIPKRKFSKYVLKHNDRLEFNKDKVRVR